MRLLEAGLARDLLISGVPEAVRLGDIIALEPDVAGRATCCITLGRAATDTMGNAEEAAKWMRERGFHSLRLDRKRVGWGKSVHGRVAPGGLRMIKKKKQKI